MDINKYTVVISKKPGLEDEISDREIREAAVIVRNCLENSSFNITGSYERGKSVTLYIERLGDASSDISNLRKIITTGAKSVRPKKKIALNIALFQPK